MRMPVGFLLHASYRLERGLPVVVLDGILEDGSSFLIRETHERPRFWIRAADVDAARAMGIRGSEEHPPRTTLGGEPVVLIEARTAQESAALRDRLTAARIACFEADLRLHTRYLIDRGIRGALSISGTAVAGEGVRWIFVDPEVTPASFRPRLRVLSLDIETDPRASQILSISLVGAGADEVLLVPAPGRGIPPSCTPCRDERALLALFVERVRALDPDVLTGWNVVDFDAAVLERRAHALGVSLALGRGPESLVVRRPTNPNVRSQALVPGRVVLDGIHLVRDSFIRLESFTLHGAATEILGRGKTVVGPDRAEEILRLHSEDPARFVEYNRNDARLVLEILERLRLVELAVERSLLTGMMLDRVSASVASFELLYLSALQRRRVVAPSADDVPRIEETLTGGHVLEPTPGVYRDVLVLDFKSLYPSLIRTFQIDPLGFLPAPQAGDDPIVAPNGAAFRRAPGILPALLDELFPAREARKAAGDSVGSHAIKILMNSFYGVLGTSACRFASAALANAITGFGREILLWTKARVEAYGHRVLYGDTDSLFILPGEGGADGNALAASLNRDLAAHIPATWRVESRLEIEFETLFRRLFLPPVRHGVAGARKRYVGLVGDDVVFTGMEAVRSDWTDLAHDVQHELYRRFFHDEPIQGYLREVVAEVRAGGHDARLVYRKALRKEMDAYTATTPPHVAAARKMAQPPGRVVAYVVTRQGPEPVEERRAPIDYEHYVEKQIRPIAEPLLAILGLDFDRVIGDDAQLLLF
jgi:DNA polymerase-2